MIERNAADVYPQYFCCTYLIIIEILQKVSEAKVFFIGNKLQCVRGYVKIAERQ